MSKRHKVPTVDDGEKRYFSFSETHYIGCCDCELTHSVKITPSRKGVILQFWRDGRRTAQRRRRYTETLTKRVK